MMNQGKSGVENVEFDIDGLREKINLLQSRAGRLSWAKASVQLSTELFILENNLEDFVSDHEVSADYFQVVGGAFEKSVKGLESLLPNISDESLALLTQEIIAEVNGMIQALARESRRVRSWSATL